MVEQIVATKVVAIIDVGSFAPAATKKAIPVAGINCTLEVLIAKKVHIALVATPGKGFNVSNSVIAFNPIGVAALLSPEHIGSNIHHYGAHGRVIRRHLRKQPAQDWPQDPPKTRDQTRLLSDFHQAQPYRHDPN